MSAHSLSSVMLRCGRVRRNDRADRSAGTNLCPKRQLPVRTAGPALPAVGNRPGEAESEDMPAGRDNMAQTPAAEPARPVKPARRAAVAAAAAGHRGQCRGDPPRRFAAQQLPRSPGRTRRCDARVGPEVRVAQEGRQRTGESGEGASAPTAEGQEGAGRRGRARRRQGSASQGGAGGQDGRRRTGGVRQSRLRRRGQRRRGQAGAEESRRSRQVRLLRQGGPDRDKDGDPIP
ncbi:hypothetical protein SAMN04489729_1666 [Amycolatopsis lurida]|nr:hypothetical protein SAMN04489729_1666 [Amycolatopsis lurida]